MGKGACLLWKTRVLEGEGREGKKCLRNEIPRLADTLNTNTVACSYVRKSRSKGRMEVCRGTVVNDIVR